MIAEEFAVLITALLAAALVSLTIFLLSRIDRAAKQVRARVNIHLVDLFSLSFLIAIPLAIVSASDFDQGNGIAMLYFCTIPICAMVLIWWTTINVVSKAGISDSRWRAAVSLIVIPVCYIGNAILVILTWFLLTTNQVETEYLLLECLLIFLHIASIFIVFGAINAANLARRVKRKPEADNDWPMP